MKREPQLNRRYFLRLSAIAATAALFPRTAFSIDARIPEKSLAFYNTHTGETLKSVYWADGRYLGDSLRAINHILRDPRNNEIHDIDTRLLDLLFSLRREVDTSQPFHVISGYRSAETNTYLRTHTTGVTENSLHLVGQAIDIRSPGRELRSLQKAAIQLRGGGVGYYPKSDFVHIDIGRVRYW
ncbi:MAG TPA: YcbK family protein [Candidatus Binatia bacterium]|nr:YcbK family protein [Candidatus Binatia bacterium]